MKFNSILNTEIESYLQLVSKTFTAGSLKHCKESLTSLDQYLYSKGITEKALPETVVSDWCATLSGITSTRCSSISYIRGFCEYLRGMGIMAFVPDMPKRTDIYAPYIYSDEEIKTLLNYADNFIPNGQQKNKLITLEFPLILRLLYCCGLRIGEAVTLQMRNVDLENGIIEVLESKGKKDRLVPMHPSLIDIFNSYCLITGIRNNINAWVFPGADCSEHLTSNCVLNLFHLALRKTGIAKKTEKPYARGQCLHSLRHTFAFQSFRKAELDGRTVEFSIPFLSTYMGHDSLYETEYYLKFSNELYPESIDLFESFTTGIFPEVAI